MNISVIGLGYIGLPTAAILASKNLNVTGIDINLDIVEKIKNRLISLNEPDLKSLVNDVVSRGKLTVQSEPAPADIYIISVPTPLKDNNKPDISYIKKALLSIVQLLKKGDLIILESTSPVGTTEKLVEWIGEERLDLNLPDYDKRDNEADISIAYCPERVLPGKIIEELVMNNRIIGGISKRCSEKASQLFEHFVVSKCYLTDSRTAELCKLVENSYRDVNIAFANELSLICDKLEIDVWQLISLANHHPRVDILRPGPGVGGHCIAVDPWFIIDKSKSESKIIKTARMVNDNKPNFVIQKIDQCVKKINKKKSKIKISSFGLSFKANVDDLRESPAVEIASRIQEMNFLEHFIVEPNIINKPSSLKIEGAQLVSIQYALDVSDIIVLLVDHDEFKKIDPAMLKEKEIIDTRGIWAV